jgi:hypothetical protein
VVIEDTDVEESMGTKINEIADGIYRLSTYVPDIAPPAGLTFNQFLVFGDEPLMFHTGHGTKPVLIPCPLLGVKRTFAIRATTVRG